MRQLEEQDAERVDVGGGGDRLAQQLLGAGVRGGHRPEVAAGGFPQRQREGVRIEQLGDAEVEQLGLGFGGDQDVRRLEVAVHHQLLVGVAHRAADLAEKLQPFRRGRASFRRRTGRRGRPSTSSITR